jgi:two-component system chemotaxis response regulator CheY
MKEKDMGKTVVIVDDSPFVTDLLGGYFEDRLGFRTVAIGTNGFHAVSLYRQHRPDLISIDLTMPLKDGKDALREILAEDPGARILLVTAQMGPLINECLKLGAAGYVEKPLRFDDPGFRDGFAATVSRCLGPR